MFNVVFCFAKSVVNNLNVSFSRLITSVGEERAVFFSAIVYSYFYCFCSKEFLFLGKCCAILLWRFLGVNHLKHQT